MKNYIFAALISFLSCTVVVAQESTKRILPIALQCDNVENMFSLIKDYGEQPLFMGNGMITLLDGQIVQGGTMFFVNQETGTWSMVTLFADGTSCMTQLGTGFSPYSQGTVAINE